MNILGITGPIGHGKSTFALCLAAIEPTAQIFESWLLIAEVAAAWQATLSSPIEPENLPAINRWLKQLSSILIDTVHLAVGYSSLKLTASEVAQRPADYQKLFKYLHSVQQDFSITQRPITAEHKEFYRPLLQWLGGYLVQQVEAGIWWNEIVRRMTIAADEGCRLALAAGLRYPTDATIVAKRGGKIIKIYRPSLAEYDLADPTEHHRDSIPIDCTVKNNGDLENLKRTARAVYHDLRRQKLSQIYQASHY